MKKFAIIAAAILFMILPIGFFVIRQMGGTGETSMIGSMQTYRSPKEQYSVPYPTQWTIKEEEDQSVYFISPQEGKFDTIHENINITFEALTEDAMTLASYSASALAQVTGLKGYRFLSSEKGKVGGEPAEGITYEAEAQGTILRLEQLWAIHDGHVVILTLAAEPRTFPAHVRILRRMARLLRFLPV